LLQKKLTFRAQIFSTAKRTKFFFFNFQRNHNLYHILNGKPLIPKIHEKNIKVFDHFKFLKKWSFREREHFLEIFKIQVNEIILPEVVGRLLSIGWVPMS
jgi:hypothetical protein